MTRAQYEEAAHRFLQLLEARDVDAWADLFAEDGANYFPFHSDLIGDSVLAGREAIRAAWRGFPERYEQVRLPLHMLFVDEEQRTVVMQLSSRNVMTGGEVFACDFVFVLRYDDEGKVLEYHEYYNPIVTGIAFGVIEVNAREGATSE